jgi:hypothetical protein
MFIDGDINGALGLIFTEPAGLNDTKRSPTK